MTCDRPDLTDDQRAAVAAWKQSQDKAEQARKLTEDAATEAREAVTALSRSGMSQKAIAALLGIGQQRVSQLIIRISHR